LANAVVTRIGSVNQDVATLDKERAIFLKVFAGEVLTAFEEKTTVLDKHYIRTIQSGKSASFPVMGKMPDAQYHTPGDEILGQKINHAEKIITIDKLLLSHAFIADIDEAMNHYDVRSRYAAAMGNRLATTFDNHVYREIITAARATSAVTGGDDGKVIEVANLASGTAATKWAAWIAAIRDVQVNFDNKNIPDGERYLALKPEDWWFLTSHVESSGASLLSRDLGGNGSLTDGGLYKILGVKLVPTPALPKLDYRTAEFHAVDCATTVGVAWTTDAVGTVKLMDLSMQSEYDIRRQGTLMVGRYAFGHGVLRPECAVELRTADPTTDD
jgi:hypothetical protein